MDQNPINPQSSQNPEPTPGPLIRTMFKDIESLEKKPAAAPASAVAAYEPPPEMPLGMAPPLGEEPTAGGPPIEIPVMEIPAAEQPPIAMPQPPTPPPVPSWTAETVISEKALTEFAPPQPPKKDIKKLAIIAGAVGLAIILGLAGWFFYPKIFPAATPTPVLPTPIITLVLTPSPTTTPTPSATPIAFFVKPPEKIAVLTITAETKTELTTIIKNEMQKIETVGTLKVIDLRKNGEPLTFNQFAILFGINIPTTLKSLIAPEFKLLVNYHAQEGSKLGLVLYLTDPAAGKTALTAWEIAMAEDLADLFLGADTGTKTEFKDGKYRDVPKRFLAFSKPPFSVDYALYENFLVIGTSRYSFSNALDHMIKEMP